MNNTDVKRWFEGLPLSAAEFFRICDKCKYAIRINGGRHEYHYLGKCKPEARDSSEPESCDCGAYWVKGNFDKCPVCHPDKKYSIMCQFCDVIWDVRTGYHICTAAEPTNWNAMGYCAKHQAPMLDHEGCYVCKTAVTLPPMTERQTDWQIASPKVEPPSLSLLVVDFGSHCVFKVESPDESVILYDYPCDAGRICVVSEPFEDVKAAIDQLEDKPHICENLDRGNAADRGTI